MAAGTPQFQPPISQSRTGQTECDRISQGGARGGAVALLPGPVGQRAQGGRGRRAGNGALQQPLPPGDSDPGCRPRPPTTPPPVACPSTATPRPSAASPPSPERRAGPTAEARRWGVSAACVAGPVGGPGPETRRRRRVRVRGAEAGEGTVMARGMRMKPEKAAAPPITA